MPIDIGKAFRLGTCAIALMLLSVGKTHAQQQFVGQWSCEFSYTEYNNAGKRSSGFTMVFGTIVRPDGSFYAEGQEQSIMGVLPFQAQGNWFIENGNRGPLFNARGQKNGPTGVSPFGYVGFIGPDKRVLFHSHEVPNTQTGRVTSRSSTECLRAN